MVFVEAVPLKDTLIIANDICGQTLQINIKNNTVLLFFVKWPVQNLFLFFLSCTYLPYNSIFAEGRQPARK